MRELIAGGTAGEDVALLVGFIERSERGVVK